MKYRIYYVGVEHGSDNDGYDSSVIDGYDYLEAETKEELLKEIERYFDKWSDNTLSTLLIRNEYPFSNYPASMSHLLAGDSMRSSKYYSYEFITPILCIDDEVEEDKLPDYKEWIYKKAKKMLMKRIEEVQTEKEKREKEERRKLYDKLKEEFGEGVKPLPSNHLLRAYESVNDLGTIRYESKSI